MLPIEIGSYVKFVLRMIRVRCDISRGLYNYADDIANAIDNRCISNRRFEIYDLKIKF